MNFPDFPDPVKNNSSLTLFVIFLSLLHSGFSHISFDIYCYEKYLLLYLKILQIKVMCIRDSKNS